MDRRLDQIRRADVITILSPVMAEKPATGSKLHGWIRGALAWDVAREYLEFNVADGIGAALPSARKAKKHHAAQAYSEVGAALNAIANCGAYETVKACLRFIILTGVRSGEARGAEWSEMNLPAAEWRIPAERMKGGREHRVPLSRAAMETLEVVRGLRDPVGWCFPSPTRAGKHIQVSTLAQVLRRIYGDRCTVHGFRSSFATGPVNRRACLMPSRRRRWPIRSEAPWSGPTPGRTCSRSGASSWIGGQSSLPDRRSLPAGREAWATMRVSAPSGAT